MKKAFTLIELLVVLAIIALLLAILLPSLKHAHEAGHMSVCLTQENQIFQASFQYANDNEDRLPYFAWLSGRSTNEWWATQVAQIMDQFEPETYTCPSDANPHLQVNAYYVGRSISMVAPPTLTTGKGKNTQTRQPRRVTVPITYRGACDLVEYQLDTTGPLIARKLSSWTRPEKAVMLIEARAKVDPSMQDRECYRFLDDLGAFSDPAFEHPYHEDWVRHLGQFNYQFIDGHAGSMDPRHAAELANEQEYYLP